MGYPGNPSLAQDVQERISNTFQQTLGLVTQNKEQEALVGCEFILRMDPQYQPAKTLVARLQGEARPVSLADLQDSPGGQEPVLEDLTQLADMADLEELDDLDDLADLDALEDFDDQDLATAPPPGTAIPMPAPGTVAPVPAAPEPAAPVPAAPEPAAPPSGLAVVIQDLLAKRSFSQILQIASAQKQAVAIDPQVQAMVEKAQGLLESETYVLAFVKSAAEARDAGQLDEMEKHLRKARSLDPEHPDVVGFAVVDPAPPSVDDLLTLDEADSALGFDQVAPASSDDDLMALQEQSLSLEAEPKEVSDLSRDPRQTHPMAAVSNAEVDAEQVFEEEPAILETVQDTVDGDLDAELTFAEEPAVLETLQDGFADDGFADDLGAELAAGDDLTIPAVGQGAAEDGGNRVDQLLEEGQEAFDRDEYQAAIDVWSRIFLIDIDNEEASSRIEEARSKKAELERQAEELFHEAAAHLESESVEEAKAALERVVQLQPNHSLANEYLEQLSSGQMPTIAPAGDLDAALADLEGTSEFAMETAAASADSPSLEAAVQRDRVVVVKRTDTRIIAFGALVLFLVIGGAAFLVLKWDDLFPNQEAPPTMAQQRQVDPIERATKMHQGGSTENAIIMLERIQPQDPIYEDAQSLIAQWKALVEAPPPLEDVGPSAEQRQRYQLLLGAARNAHQQRRYIRARNYFDLAAKILPLEGEAGDLKAQVDEMLFPLEETLSLFKDGQYTTIIPLLWRKRESDPSNLDVQRLLVDSYYNLALTDLQRGNAQGAATKLRDAIEVQPENEELERLRLFALTYAQRQQDLLYRIFVKYLPSR